MRGASVHADFGEPALVADFRLENAAEAGDEEPIRVEFRGDHADLLQQRFEREGVGVDLDRAVALYQRAVREMPETGPARVGLLNDWGICLWTRYGHTGRIEDLVTAESAFRAALDLAAPSAPDRPIYLDNLGTCLVDRYRAEADAPLLASAAAAYLEALAALPDTSPARLRIEANYASALWEQWANTGEALVLDAVIDSLRRVLARVPPNSVGRVRWSSNLAVALERRFGASGLDSDLDQAVELHLTACTMGMTADLGWSLHSARNWGRAAMARGAWWEAARAHRYGQDASRRLFTLQHGRRHKEDWLRQAIGLTVDAAVASLHLGNAAEAVRTLEEGRAQVLSETLARNALDLAGLTAAGRADLASRYRSAVSKLTWLDGRVDAAGGRPTRAGSQLSSHS
jgi:tetratricopeptide (TPR) repeat protein